MALTNGDGLPLAIAIGRGNRHDVVLTDRTLDAAFVDELPPRLIGDRAWDSGKHARLLAAERNIELIAPEKRVRRGRKQDRRALRRYKRRWKVERLFAWLKQMRRLGTRWEFKAANYLGFLQLGCLVLLLRRF
jgi:transposase